MWPKSGDQRGKSGKEAIENLDDEKEEEEELVEEVEQELAAESRRPLKGRDMNSPEGEVVQRLRLAKWQ